MIETPVRARDTVFMQIEHTADITQQKLAVQSLRTQLLNPMGAPINPPIETQIDPLSSARIGIEGVRYFLSLLPENQNDPLVASMKVLVDCAKMMSDMLGLAMQAKEAQEKSKILTVPGGSA